MNNPLKLGVYFLHPAEVGKLGPGPLKIMLRKGSFIVVVTVEVISQEADTHEVRHELAP